METFSDNKPLCNWIEKAQKRVSFQGLPARICWLGYGERAAMGKIFNDPVELISPAQRGFHVCHLEWRQDAARAGQPIPRPKDSSTPLTQH